MVAPVRGHYLRRNKANQRPSRILFFDVESDLTPLTATHTQHTPKLICASYLRLWRNGRPPSRVDTIHYASDSFWNEVEKRATPKHPLYVVAHNLNYDLGVLAWDRELVARGWTLGWMYIRGGTNIIRMSQGNRKLLFVDNMNWFKGTLAALGQVVGLPKLDVDPLHTDDAHLLPYCQRDVEIMVRAWLGWFAFLDAYDLGNWGTTAPSQAYHAFRHRFLHHNLLIHDHEEALALERAAYRGGRTSVFYRGDLSGQPIYKLDLNSAYPAVMQREAMPSRLLFYTTHVRADEIAQWLQTRCVIAEVDLMTTGNPFPIHHRDHNVYPIGAFTTTLSTPELRYALAHRWITHVHKAAVYQADVIFRDYVTELYALRQKFQAEKNPVYNYLVKLMLNGLYGKFGQTGTEFTLLGPADDVFNGAGVVTDLMTKERYHIYRFGNDIYREINTGETNSSMPAIAAHVTAYVRMELYQLREQAGPNQVYYCDTDSLFVTPLGRQRLAHLLDDARLGALKQEDHTDRLTILAPKCYRWKDTWTRKGVPQKAIETAPNTFTFTQFPSLRKLAKRPPNQPFYTIQTHRTLAYQIYDGTPQPDGWVQPLTGEEVAHYLQAKTQTAERLWELDTTIASIQEARLLAPSDMLRLWDYRSGSFRPGHDRLGNVVSPEYSTHDDRATELGFADLDSLQSAVTKQLSMDKQVRTLRSERRRLLQHAETIAPQNAAEPSPVDIMNTW